MKPIHKFNNGRGAMLCNKCRTIISTGPATKELYCEKCKPKQKNKMKNIHILQQTDKPSRLHEYDFLSPMGLSKEPLQWRLGRNIYITSDEEIKFGNYGLGKNNSIYKFDETTTLYCVKMFDCKKIILTTDPKLIENGVQAIDDEFLDWFVKNSSCEEVETKVEFIQTPDNLKDGFYYKIIIPKEEPKQETLEEVAEIFVNNRFAKQISGDKTYPDIYASKEAIVESHILFTKWQQERMYSEEDMRDYAIFYYTHQGKATKYWGKDLFKEWFKQFKKK